MKETNTIIETIKDLASKGKPKGAIEGFIVVQYDIDSKKAKELINETLGTHGKGKTNIQAIVKVIRENKHLPKKELAQKVLKVTDNTPSTVNHILNYVNFMVEYAKQEKEANQ